MGTDHFGRFYREGGMLHTYTYFRSDNDQAVLLATLQFPTMTACPSAQQMVLLSLTLIALVAPLVRWSVIPLLENQTVIPSPGQCYWNTLVKLVIVAGALT